MIPALTLHISQLTGFVPSQHFKAFTNKKTKISNISDHLISMNHSITDINNNMEIVEINSNKNDIIQLAKLYIYLHKTIINDESTNNI